ncbi:MAG: hypothetical protein ACRDHL_13140, partial [Candidatus Promineifilaceae bacterium]
PLLFVLLAGLTLAGLAAPSGRSEVKAARQAATAMPAGGASPTPTATLSATLMATLTPTLTPSATPTLSPAATLHPAAFLPLAFLAPTLTPSPTATASPSPTLLPGPAWLARLNALRLLMGLGVLVEEPAWSNGDWLHSRYMVKTDTVGHSEDPSSPWYTPEGDEAAGEGNVFVSSDAGASDDTALDWWLSAPFHAVALLDPQLVATGYGAYRESDGGWQMGATVDVGRGHGPLPPGATFPLPYPAAGSQTALLEFGGYEWPDPLASCPGYSAPAGLPLLLQLGDGSLNPAVSSHSLTQGGQELPSCRFDETDYFNPDGGAQSVGRVILNSRDAVVIIPRDPLTPGVSYTASVTAGGQTFSWSFSVSAAARPLFQPGVLVTLR